MAVKECQERPRGTSPSTSILQICAEVKTDDPADKTAPTIYSTAQAIFLIVINMHISYYRHHH